VSLATQGHFVKFVIHMVEFGIKVMLMLLFTIVLLVQLSMETVGKLL